MTADETIDDKIEDQEDKKKPKLLLGIVIKGVPGIGSSESPSVSVSRKASGVNIKSLLKKVKEFFDEL